MGLDRVDLGRIRRRLSYVRIIDAGNEFLTVALGDTQDHHPVFDGCAVQVVQRHVLWNGQCRRVIDRRYLIQDDVAQVRRQGRRLLRVFLEFRTHLREYLVLDDRLFVRIQEVVVAGVGLLEVAHVDKVVDTTLDVGHCRLIGSEAPLVIDDELERVLALLQVVDIRKVVAAPVHLDLLLPVVERARDIHLSAAVLPSEHRRHELLLCSVVEALRVHVHPVTARRLIGPLVFELEPAWPSWLCPRALVDAVVARLRFLVPLHSLLAGEVSHGSLLFVQCRLVRSGALPRGPEEEHPSWPKLTRAGPSVARLQVLKPRTVRSPASRHSSAGNPTADVNVTKRRSCTPRTVR
mmetsp:Transcript_6143/g.14423  ORF Transcript_6143/g.14423 Transcript_6143/m.14423 type:complete len:350 (-) Transcript_6143:2-1051(-)